MHGALLMMGGLVLIMIIGLIIRNVVLSQREAQAQAAARRAARPLQPATDVEAAGKAIGGAELTEADVAPNMSNIVWEAGKLATELAAEDEIELEPIETESEGGDSLAEVDWPPAATSQEQAAAASQLASAQALPPSPSLTNPHHVGAAANATPEDVAMLHDIRTEAVLRSRNSPARPGTSDRSADDATADSAGGDGSPSASVGASSSRAPTEATSEQQRWRQKKKRRVKGSRHADKQQPSGVMVDDSGWSPPACTKLADDELAC